MRGIFSSFPEKYFFPFRFLRGKNQTLRLSALLCIALGFFLLFFASSVFSIESEETSLTSVATSSSSAALLVSSPSFNPESGIASPDVTASILKVSGGLLLVILAIFGSAWFFRRFGSFSPVANDSLRVIGGLTLGQKEKIVLLQVGDEQVLIGVAPGNIQKLHVLETPIKLKEHANKQKNAFSESLGEALAKLKK